MCACTHVCVFMCFHGNCNGETVHTLQCALDETLPFMYEHIMHTMALSIDRRPLDHMSTVTVHQAANTVV